MKRSFTLLFALASLAFSSITTVKAQAVAAADSLALVDLYNSTNGALWTHHTNWLTTAPVSKWDGITVTCTRVTGIDLSVNNLAGVLPASIGNMTALQRLYLYNNRLTGSLPYSIGNLVNLYDLLLNANQLSGAIPLSIGKLVHLQQLDLSNNKLSNAIPATIGNLAQAQYISISNNELTNRIPFSIGNLAAVQVLNLANNSLSSSIPFSIGNLSHLQYLYLQNNELSGSIPFTIGDLQSLQFLYLNNNKLSGAITSAIGNLVNLQLLFINDNQLTGTLPSSVGKLNSLAYLYANDNNLSGALPVSLITLTNLQYLYLDHNHFSQGANKNPALPLNLSLHADISHNDFTFDGLEFVATHYPFVTYSPQASLPVHTHNNVLYIHAGGTLSNNSYTWFTLENKTSTAIQGDSAFHPAASGRYYAQVRNAMATQLILYTDTFTYTTPLLADKTVASLPGISRNALIIYPNPARDIVHVRVDGNAIITVTDANGKQLLSKNINGNAMIDVSRFAAGTYYLQNTTTGEMQKLVVVH